MPEGLEIGGGPNKTSVSLRLRELNAPGKGSGAGRAATRSASGAEINPAKRIKNCMLGNKTVRIGGLVENITGVLFHSIVNSSLYMKSMSKWTCGHVNIVETYSGLCRYEWEVTEASEK